LARNCYEIRNGERQRLCGCCCWKREDVANMRGNCSKMIEREAHVECELCASERWSNLASTPAIQCFSSFTTTPLRKAKNFTHGGSQKILLFTPCLAFSSLTSLCSTVLYSCILNLIGYHCAHSCNACCSGKLSCAAMHALSLRSAYMQPSLDTRRWSAWLGNYVGSRCAIVVVYGDFGTDDTW
jgi:hypothetical protein